MILITIKKLAGCQSPDLSGTSICMLQNIIHVILSIPYHIMCYMVLILYNLCFIKSPLPILLNGTWTAPQSQNGYGWTIESSCWLLMAWCLLGTRPSAAIMMMLFDPSTTKYAPMQSESHWHFKYPFNFNYHAENSMPYWPKFIHNDEIAVSHYIILCDIFYISSPLIPMPLCGIFCCIACLPCPV